MVKVQLGDLPKQIESCVGLIHSKALQTHRRLSSAHKRWIDPEDLIQEGMLAALETKGHVEGKGLKFSTYLYNSLDWHFDKKYISPLRQEKRNVQIMEIDAPISGSDNEYQFQLQGSDGREDVIQNEAVRMFLELCRCLSAEAILVLAKGLLCSRFKQCTVQNEQVFHNGKILRSRSDVYLEISQTAQKCRIGIDSFKPLFMEEKSCKKALEKLGEFVTLGMGKEMEARVLECVRCTGRFSLLDVGSGRYVVETLTCRTCHKQMQASSEICFGKVKTSDHEGYSEVDIECRLHCRDKKICRQFIKGKERTMPDEKDPLEGVDLDSVDATATAKKKAVAKKPVAAKVAAAVTKAKAAKAEKEKKVKKTAAAEKPPKAEKVKAPKKAKEKTDDEIDIEKFLAKHPECGPRLPHKNGSVMQYCFRQALEGIKADKLQKEVEELGYNWSIMQMVLRRGFTGEKRLTHSWKLSEEGGFLKISNVKYEGKVKEDE